MISNKRLAEMWCELNRFKIPKELKRTFNKSHYDSGEILVAMKFIERVVGKKALLKEWNKDKGEK